MIFCTNPSLSLFSCFLFHRPEKLGTKNEPEQEDTEDIVAPTFLENLRDFPPANQESFHKTDPLLIQEKAHAEEQLIVKVSFCAHSSWSKKVCEMINGIVSKPKKRKDKE